MADDVNMFPRKLVIFAAIFSTACLSIEAAEILKDATGKVQLHYVKTDNGIKVELIRNGEVQLAGKLGVGKNLEQVSCIEDSICTLGDNEQLSIKPIENGFNITWVADNPDVIYEDCYQLHANTTHWYGGPQRATQVWPLEKMTINMQDAYVIRRTDHFAIAERYWLNSRGVFIWLEDTTPLWVDQNNREKDTVCFRAEAKAPYINRSTVSLSYILMSLTSPKVAHLLAVERFLNMPQARPNDKMISEPIFTTWARYKKHISDAVVLEFANEIRSHGYTGGQLEIDDNWETCYGAQEFNGNFSDIKNTVATLHKDNWRVSLWIHPFVNDNCQNNSRVGQELGYFVKNTTNDTKATWWNGQNAHQIDFTKPDAAEWWSARVRKLREDYGIDSFKFDGGETDYANQPNVYDDIENTPNILTQKYISTCVQFGDLIEFRAAFRGQQHGKFVRMLDKSSTWKISNGLASLITTLLQFNMNGYGMVLPDMIGGNGYHDDLPTAELLVRWTQANTFMPSMQFSYLPWDFKDQVSYDIEGIVKKFVDLHAQYAPVIIRAMNKSMRTGAPVNPPLWWIDPEDPIALASDDEYLVGEEIIVAPVIVEGATSRNVYLPIGQWEDGNNGTIYQGPINLTNYPAPIEVLPYFIRY